MSFSVKVQQFSGPLHVLLDLIEKEQMDISEVSLASVTESYLAYVDANPEIPLEELADFLVIAAKLLLIKSRTLLPVTIEEDEPVQDLEAQLKIYREYLEASEVIAGMLNAKKVLYVHDKLPQIEAGFVPPPETFTLDTMHTMFVGVLKRLTPVVRLPKAAYEKAVSIHEKIRHIQSMLLKGSRVSFKKVLDAAESKTEVIVSFLALLELVKQREVHVSQGELFHDIEVSAVRRAT